MIQNFCLGTARSGRSSTKPVPTQAFKQDSPTVETNPPPFQSFESILPCCCFFEVRTIFATLAPCLGSCKWFQWRTQCTPPCFDASTMVWTLGVPGYNIGMKKGKRVGVESWWFCESKIPAKLTKLTKYIRLRRCKLSMSFHILVLKVIAQ